MLYLTICELKGGYPVPSEEWLEMVLRGMEDLQNYKAKGKLVIHVGYAGRQAGALIWDLDSNEELMRILSQLPYWPFLEWEIIPLISTEQAIASLRQALASVREGKAVGAS